MVVRRGFAMPMTRLARPSQVGDNSATASHPAVDVTDIRTVEVSGGLGYELDLDAPPDAVWRLWTEPDQIIRWMGDGATLQPWPGGIFRLEYASGDVVAGEFVDAEKPQHLAFTWGWDEAGALTPPGSTRVELTFEPIDGGRRTRLHMRHVDQPEAALENHDAGWRFFLARLVEACAAAT
jgi:uncharacterized protein YndB with AHSA1/START domain